MNKISNPFALELSAIQAACDLFNRSLDENSFEFKLSLFVDTVSLSGRSISKSLNDREKVKALISDFKAYYFDKEQDLFSHRLMKKVIKHPKVEEQTFQDIKKFTKLLLESFKSGCTLYREEGDWSTHLVLTLFDPSKFFIPRCPRMPEEVRQPFLNKKLALVKELSCL